MNVRDYLSKFFFFRQHPDAALRYLPIVDLIKKENLADGKILEVGSGSYGITPYLKKEVIGLDMSFDEPRFPLLKQVRGSGDKLPFKKNSFDVVILSDVLEHLPWRLRGKVLNEAIRVARKVVVVSGPFGKHAANQDKLLAAYSLKVLGKMHPYFKDHLKYGLPEIIDIEALINQSKKVKSIEIIGEFLNLAVRQWLMKFFITNNKFVFYLYLKVFMLLVPFLRTMNQKPCYRVLLEIKF